MKKIKDSIVGYIDANIKHVKDINVLQIPKDDNWG